LGLFAKFRSNIEKIEEIVENKKIQESVIKIWEQEPFVKR